MNANAAIRYEKVTIKHDDNEVKFMIIREQL